MLPEPLQRFLRDRQRPLLTAAAVTLVGLVVATTGLNTYRQRQQWEQTRNAAEHLSEYLERPQQRLSLLALTLRLSLEQMHHLQHPGQSLEHHPFAADVTRLQEAIGRRREAPQGLQLAILTPKQLFIGGLPPQAAPPPLLAQLEKRTAAATRKSPALLADLSLIPAQPPQVLYAEPMQDGAWAIAAMPEAQLIREFSHSAAEELGSYRYRLDRGGSGPADEPHGQSLPGNSLASSSVTLALPILSGSQPWRLQVEPRDRSPWEPAQVGITLLALGLGLVTYRLLRVPNQLARQLEEQTDELRLVQKALEDSRNGVLITGYNPDDPANRYPIRYVNRAFTAITGYEPEEVIGYDCRLLQNQEDNADARARIREALRQGRSCRELLRNRRRDGTLFWNELTISPMLNARGELVAFLGFQQDVTERVEATRQLEQRNRELEQARREAEAADEAKGRFLATMSHELRTPLNAVIGMTHLLQGTRLDPEQQTQLQTIQTSSELLLGLISDILDFSKIESGSLELCPEGVDPIALVDEITNILAPLASSKGLDLYAPIDPQLPARLTVDPLRLRQVLLNLVGNAIKFTDVGSVSLTLEQQIDAQGQHWLLGRVRDTGIGIPSAQQDRLFAPFAQGDSTTTRRFGGTGLGLVISRRLCDLMGGDLLLEQSSARGSCFLWRIRVEADDPSPPPPVADPQMVRLLCHRQEPLRHLRSRLERLGHRLSNAGRCDPPIAGEWLLLGPRLLRRNPELLPLARSFGDRLVLLGDIPCPELPRARRLALPARLTQLASLLSPAQAPAPVTADPEPTDMPTSELRILLAEDNPINQRVALALLERWGYRADVVPSGREILDQLPDLPYDLVLMDLQMPEVDGYEATRAIRRGCRRQPWIVAMTANALESDRQQCLDAGMNDYLSKPIRPQQLQAAISRAARALQPSPPASA